MHVARAVSAACLVCAGASLFVPAHAQDVSTAPPTSANAPTLAQTFDFIQRKLPGLRTIPSGRHPISDKIVGVSFNGCSMQLTDYNGQSVDTAAGLLRRAGESALADPSDPNTELVGTITRYTVSLSAIDNNVSVSDYAIGFSYLNIGDVNTNAVSYVRTGLTPSDTDDNGSGTDGDLNLLVENELAPRLQAAFTHAIELCKANPGSAPRDTF